MTIPVLKCRFRAWLIFTSFAKIFGNWRSTSTSCDTLIRSAMMFVSAKTVAERTFVPVKNDISPKMLPIGNLVTVPSSAVVTSTWPWSSIYLCIKICQRIVWGAVTHTCLGQGNPR